jgi:NADH-quinone oxidoreductase subunit N
VAEWLPEAVRIAAPALSLIIGGCLLFCSSIALKPVDSYNIDSRRNLLGAIAFAFLLLATGFHVANQGAGGLQSSTIGLFRLDSISMAAERLTLIGGFVILLTGWSIGPKKFLAEYYGCLLLILAGIPLVGASRDLIAMFLSLELVSIPTYILLSIARSENPSLEAGLKYFLLSAFSSCFFLLGLSYLFGIAGSMDLVVVQEALASKEFGRLGLLAMMFVLCGLAFRITAVPFHFYGPDVFEGTSVLAASMMSYLPKVAGFVALVRILDNPAVNLALSQTLVPVLLVIAAATMCIGNAMASSQTSVRRLMGYSSVAHSGYLILAMVSLMLDGAKQGVLFTYLAAYAVMTLGVFACFAEIDEAGGRSMTIGDLSGMFYRRPAASIAMAICLLSLIGLPLTAGFVAKFQIFIAAGGINRWDVTFVTLLMAINAVIAAGYYFRILSKLFETGVNLPPLRLWRPSLFLAYSVCAVLTIVWFFQPTTM